MNPNQIARIAALVGEPARAAMLLAIMDGRALTARELASVAGITAQTASRHLALLAEAELMQVERQGRHRYHRLASPQVARMLEGLMQIASTTAPVRVVTPGPRDAGMRMARMCYDHIAGRLGLALTSRLLADGAIVFGDEGGMVMPEASAVLKGWGMDVAPLDGPGTGTRPGCRPCLDWSERRPHVAGKLGAMVCTHCIDQGWLVRRAGGRSLSVTALGAEKFQAILGLQAWDAVTRP